MASKKKTVDATVNYVVTFLPPADPGGWGKDDIEIYVDADSLEDAMVKGREVLQGLELSGVWVNK
jgi:hypothetical protein